MDKGERGAPAPHGALCFEGDGWRLKGRQMFEGKSDCPLEKILRAPMNVSGLQVISDQIRETHQAATSSKTAQ